MELKAGGVWSPSTFVLPEGPASKFKAITATYHHTGTICISLLCRRCCPSSPTDWKQCVFLCFVNAVFSFCLCLLKVPYGRPRISKSWSLLVQLDALHNPLRTADVWLNLDCDPGGQMCSSQDTKVFQTLFRWNENQHNTTFPSGSWSFFQ